MTDINTGDTIRVTYEGTVIDTERSGVHVKTAMGVSSWHNVNSGRCVAEVIKRAEPEYEDGELYLSRYGTIWLRDGDGWVFIKSTQAPYGRLARVSHENPDRPLRKVDLTSAGNREEEDI